MKVAIISGSTQWAFTACAKEIGSALEAAGAEVVYNHLDGEDVVLYTTLPRFCLAKKDLVKAQEPGHLRKSVATLSGKRLFNGG